MPIDPDALLQFNARQAMLKRFGTEHTFWECDLCPEEGPPKATKSNADGEKWFDSWAELVNHLAGDHGDDIDWEQIDTETEALLDA